MCVDFLVTSGCDFFHAAHAVHGSVFFKVARIVETRLGQQLTSSHLIAHGVGTYVRSKIALTPDVGYSS